MKAHIFRSDRAVRFVIVLVVDQHVPAVEKQSYDGWRGKASSAHSGIKTVCLTSPGCSPSVSGPPLRKCPSRGLPEHKRTS